MIHKIIILCLLLLNLLVLSFSCPFFIQFLLMVLNNIDISFLMDFFFILRSVLHLRYHSNKFKTIGSYISNLTLKGQLFQLLYINFLNFQFIHFFEIVFETKSSFLSYISYLFMQYLIIMVYLNCIIFLINISENQTFMSLNSKLSFSSYDLPFQCRGKIIMDILRIHSGNRSLGFFSNFTQRSYITLFSFNSNNTY